MRWVGENIIKCDDPCDSTVLTVEAVSDGVTHFGFVWVKGKSPTNMIEDLVWFVARSSGMMKQVSRIKRLLKFEGDRISDSVVWYDIMRPYNEGEDDRDVNYFKYSKVIINDEGVEWINGIPFEILPSEFKGKISYEMVANAKIFGVGK